MSNYIINIENAGLEASCSWEILNKKCMKDAVSLSTNLNKEKDDLENIVRFDTCIHLANSRVSPCELRLKLTVMKTLQIVKISVVSEARIIEIYGKCEEYIRTCQAEFFDECEDMLVYTADAELNQPSSECTLKFASLKKDEMWLYGIHIIVEKIEPHFSAPASVNFHHVNRILKDSGHQLTEKAEKCKKFLQLYSSILDPSKTQTKGPDPQILMKMFESEYLAQHNQFSTKARSVSKCLTNTLPGFLTSMKEKTGHEDEAGGSNKEADLAIKLGYIADSLKHHIDQRFSEFEKKINSKVEEKLKEMERKQSEKLDIIINHIESLKTVLNVRGPEG